MSNKGLTERVLIECGRSRGISKYTHSKIEAWEGTFIPNRFYKYKFNECGGSEDNLGPLYRFLGSNVGERWDNVYSKLTKKVKVNSRSGFHVLTHLERAVEFGCIFYDDDPTPHYSESRRFRSGTLYNGAFYLDLEGILRVYKAKKKNYRSTPLRTVRIGEYRYVYFPRNSGYLDGKWVNTYSHTTGWHIECLIDSTTYKNTLILEEGRPVWQWIVVGNTYKKIPKIDTKVITTKKPYYFSCSNTDMVKLRNNGVI